MPAYLVVYFQVISKASFLNRQTQRTKFIGDPVIQDGLLRVLLDEGPSWLFLPSDAKLMEEDLEVLKVLPMFIFTALAFIFY
jgi:hypothetical protein